MLLPKKASYDGNGYRDSCQERERERRCVRVQWLSLYSHEKPIVCRVSKGPASGERTEAAVLRQTHGGSGFLRKENKRDVTHASRGLEAWVLMPTEAGDDLHEMTF